MKKIKEKLLNKVVLINALAFIVPILIIVGFVCYKETLTNGNFFFHGELVNVADMGSQYTSLYTYFHNALIGRDSLLYSFSNSIGGNMASTIGYYLSSPFNILYGFVSMNDISLISFISYVIKIALCSLFMNIYLTHKFGNKYTNLLFSLTYAFMGFVIVYYFNLMWLDVIYMTPLVIMGVDKLINGKPLQYIITLSLSLIFNFYIAYMMCIFVVIYFLYELFIKYSIKDFKKYKNIIIRFIVCSLVSAGLAAFFLVPVAIGMSQIMRTPLPKDQLRITFDYPITNFLDTVFSKFYIGSHNFETSLGRNRPVLYIGLFSLVLSFLYFFNKGIKLKERILSLIIVVFFLLSFMIPHLQLFWQGFTFPNGYIDRFSFLFSFFLILLAAKQFYSNKKYKVKIWWYILFFAIFIGATIYINTLNLIFLNKKVIIITLLLVIVYLILYYTKHLLKTKINIKSMDMLIFIFVIAELVYNYNLTFLAASNVSVGSHLKGKRDYLINRYDEAYRLDGTYWTMVENFATANKGVNMAVTTNNKNLYKFLHKNAQGLSYTTIFYDFNRVPIFDSLMSVRFLHADGVKPLYFKQYKDKNGNKVASIYENPYALNIGYMIDDGYYEKFDNSNDSGFENLNNLVKSISGIDEDVLIEIPGERVGKKIKYKYKIKRKDKTLFLTTKYKLEVNFGIAGSLFVNGKHNGLLETSSLGDYALENNYYNKTLTLEVKDGEKIEDIYLYYFNEDVFKKAIDKLKEHQLKETYMQGNTVKGKISIDKKGTLLMTVPYDKGWRVYVDGKKVKAKEIAGGLIGIDLESGSHKIYMKYYCPGIEVGAIISIITLSGLILYNYKYKKGKVVKNKNKTSAKKIDKKKKV